MTDKAYPELPKEVAWRDDIEHCDLYWRPADTTDKEPLFTAAQMRAYYDLGRTAAGSGISDAEVERLRQDARAIFDGPVTAQETRDVIEWFYSSLLAMAPATTQAQEADCGNCFEGETDRGLTCRVCGGTGKPQPEHEPSPHVPNTGDCGREVSTTPCPKCGAPCRTKVNMRGGEHGWGTSDLERTDYAYAPPTAPAEAVTASGDETAGAVHVATVIDNGGGTIAALWQSASYPLPIGTKMYTVAPGDEAQLLADAERWRTLLTMRKDLVAGIVQRHELADRYKPGPWTLQEEVDAVRAAREATGGAKS